LYGKNSTTDQMATLNGISSIMMSGLKLIGRTTA